METAVLEILKQVPALAVLAWLVTRFLNEIGKRDEVLKDLSAACHDVHQRSIVAVDRNSEALGRIESALDGQRQLTTDAVRDAFSGLSCPAVKSPNRT